MTHLLALATPRGCFGLRLLAVMLPVAGIHIAFNVGGVFDNVGHHALLQSPTEEVELADGGLLNGRLTADLEADTLTTAEGIKETLGIRLEFTLVVEVDQELTGRSVRGFDQGVGHIELLGVVRDEPVDQAETHRRGARQNWENLLQSPRLVVEVLEPTNNEILFALNAALQSLACGVHS